MTSLTQGSQKRQLLVSVKLDAVIFTDDDHRAWGNAARDLGEVDLGARNAFLESAQIMGTGDLPTQEHEKTGDSKAFQPTKPLHRTDPFSLPRDAVF